MSYPWPNPENFQTVEDAFLRRMAVQVRFYRSTGTDEYNQETYAATPVYSPAYLEGGDEDFVMPGGNAIHTTGVAYLGFVIPWLTNNDRMEVPDTAEASGWRETTIGGITEAYGPTRIHHQEIHYGPLGAVGQGIGSG